MNTTDKHSDFFPQCLEMVTPLNGITAVATTITSNAFREIKTETFQRIHFTSLLHENINKYNVL